MDKDTAKVLTALVKKLPGDLIKRAADVAITTFEKCISPLTASLGGWGDILKARFEAKLAHEKVLIAETYERAKEKTDNLQVEPAKPKNINVHIVVMDTSSNESDPLKRELLANILANEHLHANVHPELIKILSLLTENDITMLMEIAKKEKTRGVKELINTLKYGWPGLTGAVLDLVLDVDEVAFSEALLLRHNLIEIWDGRLRRLTIIGKELIRCITDPQLRADANKPA